MLKIIVFILLLGSLPVYAQSDLEISGKLRTLEALKLRLEDIEGKIKIKLKGNDFCKLILIDNDKLIGFISIFPEDCDECPELSPWYATMYVKKEYRGHGYSKILNDAILKEARERGFKEIYLKTTLY